MRQTDHTAIVLRYANYRDNDRMLTLFSPTRGRIEALARGCRKPRSPLLAASELFSLGEYEVYERGNHLTVINATLTETFYPLRLDYDRLTAGTYLLGICEATVQSGEPDQELFMLLLHTLSRLTFTDQECQPLLSGFLLHYAACEGFKPRLAHCVRCGERLSDAGSLYFDSAEGGLCCHACHTPGQTSVSQAQARWMREMLQKGSASWVNTPECHAPYALLRSYVESRLGRRVKSGAFERPLF